MPKSTKTFKELLEHYKVRAHGSIDSNIVYPLDDRFKYKFHGYVPKEDVDEFVQRVGDVLNKDIEFKYSNYYIANKYAIPYLQVGEMHTVQTFFYYQHDGKTWLISLTEEVTEYLG